MFTAQKSPDSLRNSKTQILNIIWVREKEYIEVPYHELPNIENLISVNSWKPWKQKKPINAKDCSTLTFPKTKLTLSGEVYLKAYL